MKFRSKLMLSYVLLVVLITAVFYLFFELSLQKTFVEESRAGLMNQAALVDLLVEKEGQLSQPLAVKIGSAVKARVTLIAADGRVVGDSDISREHVDELQNHLDRPEVQAALKDGSGSAVRSSVTLRRDMLYVAHSVDASGASGVVRLALPLDNLARATRSMHSLLGIVALLTVVAAVMLSYLLSNVTSRPLREIAAAAGRIGRGELGVSIPVTTHDEVGELAGVLNDMSGRIDGQMKRLSREKQRLDTILRGMGEGVMVASSDGVISLVNPAFGPLFGIQGNIEGNSLIEISRHPDLLSAFNDLRVTGGELVREITIPPGTTLLTHWVPLRVDGDDQGVVAVFHDISDMKRVENMRRDFVANVSHELRTPVTVIKGYADTLLNGVLDADPRRSKQFVQVIQQHTERLSVLINDILTLSRLESKETALDQEVIDSWSAVATACMLVGEHADLKNITLVNEIHPEVHHVMADHGRLEQVVVNLLENAVKYTPEGGTVRVSSEDQGEFIRFAVSDTGIGISSGDMSRIFERFYRVDQARSREQGGTGLGLAIVKHIVQLHGGEVSVSSEPGRGSVFSFTLRKAPHAPKM
ncbi:MAG: PAS domain-containing sensor histidine kinase [Geobacteraceae bacterium GWB2_52_12]|nr:MAG: PAS domain-containing sensor histidine kinase [Geobacteraceae bacterium GWB2_52_12]